MLVCSHRSLIRLLRSRAPLRSFVRSLARSLAHSGAHGTEVFVCELNASISYSFNLVQRVALCFALFFCFWCVAADVYSFTRVFCAFPLFHLVRKFPRHNLFVSCSGRSWERRNSSMDHEEMWSRSTVDRGCMKSTRSLHRFTVFFRLRARGACEIEK